MSVSCMGTSGLYVGIDVGGTSVKEGLFTGEGDLLARTAVPTPALVDEAGYATVARGIAELLDTAQRRPDELAGIGLAVPCPVPADGRVSVMPNISLDLPGLGCALEHAYPAAQVCFANDANAAAMGELWQGSARGAANMVLLTIGTGVGGGVVVNGGLVAGVHGAGGEIGHLCMNPDEERVCGCGNHGCLEQYASATGVVTAYRDECASHGVELLPLCGPSDCKTVFDAARTGDECALAAADRMAAYLGRALALVAAVVDPESFVIGGGASAAADIFLPATRTYYQRFAFAPQRQIPIEPASLGNDAGIIGAAYVAVCAVRDA